MSKQDVTWAIGVAVIASVLLALIQVQNRSKVQLGSCLNVETLFYIVLMSFGNGVTTILVSPALVNIGSGLKDYYWILAPFFGVFGFEVVLKNTNITMFDKGVLTFQDWIDKIMNAAAASALSKDADRQEQRREAVVARLSSRPNEEINRLVLQKFGDNKVAELEAVAQRNNADPMKYKAYALAAAYSASEMNNVLR